MFQSSRSNIALDSDTISNKKMVRIVCISYVDVSPTNSTVQNYCSKKIKFVHVRELGSKKQMH